MTNFLLGFNCFDLFTGSNGSRMSGWQVDEIADNLAADLDGLGVDLSAAAASYR